MASNTSPHVESRQNASDGSSGTKCSLSAVGAGLLSVICVLYFVTRGFSPQQHVGRSHARSGTRGGDGLTVASASDIEWRDANGADVYCNILTGVWQAGSASGASSSLRALPETGSKSGRSSIRKPGRTLQRDDIDVTVGNEDWGVDAAAARNLPAAMKRPDWVLKSDWVRRQYSWLAGHRAASEAIIGAGMGKTERDGAAENTAQYSPLTAVEPSPSSPVWSWPMTDLWPMPSLLSVGLQVDMWTRAPAAQTSSSPDVGIDVIDMLRASGMENAWSVRSDPGPIHSHVHLSNDTRWHTRDSLRFNGSAPGWDPYLSPMFVFRLSQRARGVLSGSETALVRASMSRACTHMAASYRGRLSDAVTHIYGAARDSGACRQHDPRQTRVRAQAESIGNGGSGTGRPAYVLHAVEVDVQRSDSAAVPHVQMSEGYAMRMWTPHNRACSAPSVCEGSASIAADTVWGALRGIETFVQSTVQSWGILQPGPESGRFSSPTSAILACAGKNSSSMECLHMGAQRYAAAANALAVAAAEEVIAGGASCALDFLRSHSSAASPGRYDYAAPSPARFPVLIVDRPWRLWRGVSLDTARHWLPLEGIHNLLDGMSASKLNVLHWHISDAQSFPLVLLSHPELAAKGAWDKGKVYTPDDVRSLISYATARGIRVVPEFDMPAHAAAIGRSHADALVHCSSVGGGVKELDKYALDPTNEAAYSLITDVFTEAGKLFPDEFLHIGADEVASECWASESRLSAWAVAHLPHLLTLLGWLEGSSPHTGQVYVTLLAYFLHRVDAIVRSLGKWMVSWEDSYEKVQGGGRRMEGMTEGGEAGYMSHLSSLRRALADSDNGTEVPLASTTTLTFPLHSVIQGWKCWVQHADGVIAQAALDGMGHKQSPGRKEEDPSTVPGAGRAVIQSACWYMDYSSPWGDYYRHWPLPEHTAPMATFQAAINKELSSRPTLGNATKTVYPKTVFALHPFWGGEGAIWTERIDASNLACRAWPRLGVPAEVLWSESLAYDRYARQFGSDPPYTDSWGKGPSKEADTAQALFASPRYLQFTRMLLHRGLPASPTAIFDINTPFTQDTAAIKTVFEEGLQQFAFNGMCPGIEQALQRPASRLSSFLSPVAGGEGAEKGIAGALGGGHAPSPRGLTFVSWNIHDGGSTHGRYARLLEHLHAIDADVVGIIEANDWDKPVNGRALARARALQGEWVNSAGHDWTASVPRDVVLLEEEAGAEPPPWSSGSSHRNGNASHLRSAGESEVTHDFDPKLGDQTAGFRRRAATAGYTFAHLLRTVSGYHLALLSSRPMTIILQDTAHFERGLLVADVAGVRFLLVHFHAQSATERAREAEHVRALVAVYTAAGFPVVVLGDFNSLSPSDAPCHAALVDTLLAPASPVHLKDKYLCDAVIDPGCAAQSPSVGGSVGGAWRVDYRPLHALLHSSDDAGDLPLVDLALRVPQADWMSVKQSCLVSYPTSSLDPDADDEAKDNGHVPLRIDFALANAVALAEYPHLACTMGVPSGNTSALDHRLLTVSDHLPLVCAG